jgi:hypothetical protein
MTSAEGTSGDVPVPAISGSRRAVFVISLICSAQFVLQLDFSVVNVALPAIQRELGIAAAQLQWIVTGYALAFGSLLLAGGRLADLLGRRRVLAVGRAWPGPCSPPASRPAPPSGWRSWPPPPPRMAVRWWPATGCRS